MDDSAREPGGVFDYRIRPGERWTRQDDGSLVVCAPPFRVIHVLRGGEIQPFVPFAALQMASELLTEKCSA